MSRDLESEAVNASKEGMFTAEDIMRAAKALEECSVMPSYALTRRESLSLVLTVIDTLESSQIGFNLSTENLVNAHKAYYKGSGPGRGYYFAMREAINTLFPNVQSEWTED